MCNPYAERFSRHATLHADFSVSPQAELYAPMKKEEWKCASSVWNTMPAPRRSPQRSTYTPPRSATKDCNASGKFRRTEVFLRVNDMRDRKRDPIYKQKQMANLHKRCKSAAPRRLLLDTKTKSHPLDSQGGTFCSPQGVDNWSTRTGGAKDWRHSQAARSTFHPSQDHKSKLDMHTIHPYSGGVAPSWSRSGMEQQAINLATPKRPESAGSRFYYW